MSMRVIAGRAKGMRLKTVSGNSTRPIMDKVKEALFSILGQDITDSYFLDLFGGTGSVGIEALSRGAKQATFVELNRLAIRTIHENLQKTRLDQNAIVYRANVIDYLKNTPKQQYNYIFVAPPQYQGLWKEVLMLLDQHPAWVPNGTTIIIQIDPSEQETLSLTNIQATQERRYGKTLLWFFEPVPK